MTTISITVNEKLARAVEEIAQLPEEEQQRYAEVLYDLKLLELRREIGKGLDELDQGLGSPLDMDAIKTEARARWEARRT